MERLEQRRLLASALVADELVITGTADNDFIKVGIDEERGMLTVYDNGVTSEYELATISNIRIFGYAGDDYLYVDPRVPIPLLIDGGDGNDRIYGGAAADHLLGGAGDDTLVGADGDDRLEGGDGDDVISGNNGNDSLLGGAGMDTIYGGWGSDFLDGGDDLDALRGEYDADTFASNSLPEELLDFSSEDTLLVDDTEATLRGNGKSRPFKGFDSHADWLKALKADAWDNGVRRGQFEENDPIF